MKQLKIEFLYEHPVYKGYACDEQGNVYSLNYNRTGKIKKMKPQNDKGGYFKLRIWKKGNVKGYFVHRFIYECINGVIPTGYHVDHLDFNRHNNCIDNLRAIPASENMSRLSEEGRRRIGEATAKSNKEKKNKPVLQYDKQYNLIAEFPSTREASRQTGINQGSIWQCCQGKLKTAGGKLWKYKKEVA